jgi:tetratricopeptide (TPR) repeat protein
MGVLVVAAISCDGLQRASRPDGPLSPLQPLLAALGLVPGVPELPADWTFDRDKVPQSPASLALDAPLGELPAPFRQPDALKAWELQREGRMSEAAPLAEQAWKALSANPELAEERVTFAFFLAAVRQAQGNKTGAIEAARVATAHPSLGPNAVRWLAARADDQGLPSLVLSIAYGRDEPGIRLLRVRALRRTGSPAAAWSELETLPTETGSSLWRRAQVERMRTLISRGREDEGIAIARSLVTQSVKTSQAEEAVDLLIGSTDQTWKDRLKRRPQDGPAVLEALVYTAQRRRYARATPALTALADTPGVSLAVQCHARSWAARTWDRKPAFDKALALYDTMPPACDSDPEVRALQVEDGGLDGGDLAFRMGRALLLSGNPEGKAHLERALEQGLTGLDSDDAHTVLDMWKTNPEAGMLLARFGPIAARDYAEKDIFDVTVWLVAMDHLVSSRWTEALTLLDRLAQVRDSDPPPTDTRGESTARFDDRDWARGRADYFAGRALEAMGRREEARKRWLRVVQRHPLTYFAAQSYAWLDAAGGQPEKAALQTVIAPKSGEPTGPVLDAQLLAKQGVQRARLLGQLGWNEEAGDELDTLGLGRVTGPEVRWATGDPGGLWTRAGLDDEAGRWVSSHLMGRDTLRRYSQTYPHDGNRQAWKVSYPRAYRALMDGAAREFGLHPSIVYAIARAESGFNPRVESNAAAIGLLQLILPTAKEMAKPLGLVADAQTLRQPAVNVRLGARYLKRLLDRFEREAQMAAGYNAGGGAVGRWRKVRGQWPLDLYVEAIPFRETRDYAKRVLSNIAAYRNLYDGTPLHMFGLTQKPVPMSEEPPTEPASSAVEEVPAAGPTPEAVDVAPKDGKPATPAAAAAPPVGKGTAATKPAAPSKATAKPEPVAKGKAATKATAKAASVKGKSHATGRAAVRAPAKSSKAVTKARPATKAKAARPKTTKRRHPTK